MGLVVKSRRHADEYHTVARIDPAAGRQSRPDRFGFGLLDVRRDQPTQPTVHGPFANGPHNHGLDGIQFDGVTGLDAGRVRPWPAAGVLAFGYFLVHEEVWSYRNRFGIAKPKNFRNSRGAAGRTYAVIMFVAPETWSPITL